MSNKWTTFLWTICNGLVAVVISYLLDINYIYAPLIIPILNLITKEINKSFNPKYNKKHGGKKK